MAKQVVSGSWLKHCKTAEDKELFKQSLQESQSVFRVLIEIIDGKIDQNLKDREKKELYDSPNWALRQADLVGEARAYKIVEDLCRKSLTKP